MCALRFETAFDAPRAAQTASFFTTPLGKRLEKAELGALRERLGGCAGARALVLTAGVDERIADALPVARRHIVRLSAAEDLLASRQRAISSGAITVADPANLPYENDAFDVVVAVHGLDLADRPQQALRELSRVLAPGGRLLMTGFNPLSFWGARRLLTPGRAPWNAHFLAPRRVLDWLSVLDFSRGDLSFVHYRPPEPWGLALWDRPGLQTLRSLFQPPLGAAWILKVRHAPTLALRDPRPLAHRPGLAAGRTSAARNAGQVLRFPGNDDRAH